MFSLFARNLFFTILQPGIVAGLIPYWIIRGKFHPHVNNESLRLTQYLGELLLITGLVIMVSCIMNFAIKGKGTLSPADPTKELVVTGLYKYSRNPMYIGVSLILIAEALFFQSIYLWLYAALIIIAFNLFIIFFEEPRLRRDFGVSYEEYCKKTRRWI
ncbi:MAG: isoprenylcysteine carboxylmethyltransferase family protein [Chitinophagaceae bacterium]